MPKKIKHMSNRRLFLNSSFYLFAKGDKSHWVFLVAHVFQALALINAVWIVFLLPFSFRLFEVWFKVLELISLALFLACTFFQILQPNLNASSMVSTIVSLYACFWRAYSHIGHYRKDKVIWAENDEFTTKRSCYWCESTRTRYLSRPLLKFIAWLLLTI